MAMAYWLPTVLRQFVERVLAEAYIDDENLVGDLEGNGWDSFRQVMCDHANRDMSEIVAIAKQSKKSFHDMVLYLTEGLYVESGFDQAIRARKSGRTTLRTA